MWKLLVISFALTVSAATWAAEDAHTRVVDLRADHALENLERTNPAEFERIRRVIAGLTEQPKLAEGNWLQVTFAAKDVDLSKYLLRTSYPPKQLLKFTLDDTRYVMNLVRTDLTPRLKPAKRE